MPVNIEGFGSEVVGWAADDLDHADRLTIHVAADGEIVGSAIADLYRADLASAGVADASGCYGFRIAFDTDTLNLIRCASSLRCFATGRRGEDEVAVTLLPQAVAELERMKAAADGVGGVRILGASHLLDNLVEFGATETCATQPIERVYYSFKMQAFMYGMWVEDGGWSHPSAMRWLSTLGPHTLDKLRKGEMRLLLDMSNEGMVFEHSISCIEALHREFGQFAIPLGHCVILMQNLVFDRDYEIWARRQGLAERIRILCYDYFPRRFIGLRARALDEGQIEDAIARFRAKLPDPRGRRFLSFNFTPRDHRVCLVAWLLGMRYDDRGYISFAGFDMAKRSVTNYRRLYWFPEEEYVEDGLKRLHEIGRLTLDLGEQPADYVPEFDTGDARFFDDSYFSIVSETEMMEGSQRRFTEKLLKPMASFHPFVVFGNAQSLDRLRLLGFKTFHPFIDEDYDLWEEPRKRAHFAMGEINRLIDMPLDELAEWYGGLQGILEYNFRHLHANADRLYREIIEPACLQRLREA